MLAVSRFHVAISNAKSSTGALDPPNGSEQIDQSEVGLIFADPDKPKRELKIDAAVNMDFRIPPESPNFAVNAGYQFTQDTLLHAMLPHMHYRGKAFRYTAHYPTGKKEILLDVPHFDFNWQNTYELRKAKLLPKGTLVMCEGRFDNSSDNLVNPDPKAEVRWGDQTWEEMMLGAMLTSLPESVRRSEFPKVTHVKGDQFDVVFRFRPKSSQRIKTAYIAGTFNDWNKETFALKGPNKDGEFRGTLRLKPGFYEYKIVLNGNDWTHDPENPDRKGPFNNSIVRVGNRPRR